MNDITHYGNGIHAIDPGCGRPGLDAVHVVTEQGRAVLIDTAMNSGVPRILGALRTLGLSLDQVDYIILTHVHLDHAGAAGRLIEALPNARLVVHPRGARHMADPARLIAGTIAVYGAEEARRTYGEILPVDPARIIEAQHEQTLDLCGRHLLLLQTPGHARHHLCIRDGRTGHIFSGDTFGLSYRELDRDGRHFIFPTTTPTQFDPDALRQSIDLLMSHAPEAIYLTHFGQVKDIPRLAADLLRLLDRHVSMAERRRHAGDDRHALLKRDLEDLLQDEARTQGWSLQGEPLRQLFAMDLELNAQGLGCWLDAKSSPPSPDR